MTAINTLAGDIHLALCDEGLAPMSPTDNAKLRDEIERVLSARWVAPSGALSVRLRPNVECAPWVVEEVRKLEGEVEFLRTVTDNCRAEKAELLARAEASGLAFATVQKVVAALSRLGIAAPEGHEEQAARADELVSELCDAILLAAPQQASDEAWLLDPRTVEAKSQWDAVARALGADVDDPDAVLAAAKAQQPSVAPVGVEDFSQHVLRIAGYTGVHYSAKEKCELGAQFYAFTPTELHLFAERIVALAQQPAAVDEAMTERACEAALKEGGKGTHNSRRIMRAALTAALEGTPTAAMDRALAGWSLRHERGMIRVIGPDGRSYASVDPDLTAQQQGGQS